MPALRRSPRLDQSKEPTTSVASDIQQPHSSKESGLLGQNPSGTPQPAKAGQTTNSTTVEVANLLERIATLERELSKAKANEGQVETARNPVGIGLSGIGNGNGAANTPLSMSETSSAMSGATTQMLSENLQREQFVTPSLNEPLLAQLSANFLAQLSANLQPQLSGTSGQQVTRNNNCTTVSLSPPCYVTATVQPELGYVDALREPQRNLVVTAPGSYGTAPASIPNVWTPRRLPDLPEFEGQPEEWPIFQCAFTETTEAYQCTALENNQRLVKALKGEARAAVKALLIHPNNVQEVMEQLRFRYGRPEQLIRSQLESVRDVLPISEPNIARIVPFATKVSNLAAFLKSTKNGIQHLGNPTLMEELIATLPISKRLDWAKHVATIEPYPTVVHFSEWLHELARLICIVTDAASKDPKRRLLHASASRLDGKDTNSHKCCPICEGQHGIKDCEEFHHALPTARIELARKHRICFACLESGHMARFCKKGTKCSVNGCQRRHHYLLHDRIGNSRLPQSNGGRLKEHTSTRDQELQRDTSHRRRNPFTSTTATPKAGQAEDGQESPHRNLSCVDPDEDHLLFRILPVTLHGRNKQVDTYALLDEGSSVTLIDDDIIQSLNLKGESRQLNVQWFGGKTAREHTTVVSLQISGTGKSMRHDLRNVFAVSNLNLPMQSLRREDVKARKENARLPVKPYFDATPRILIGLDHAHLGIPLRTRSFGAGGPFAAATKLEWVVYGPVKGSASPPVSRSCLLAVSHDNLLEKMVSDYFETENFGVKPAPPVAAGDDVRALSILEDTTKRVGRRFQTGLLWKDDGVRLPDSYNMALKRLVSIERKMKRDEVFARAYKGIMDDYIKKGYARRLEPQGITHTNGKVWYLPHFGVENPNKPGKIRLVFDAAAKVNDISLNSALMKGPQRYKSLPAVLFHFREGAVGVCADIKEMFHQVLIQPQDRCAQRFLWRNGEDRRNPDTYEMQVMTFGAACSPCAADYVKLVNASQYSSTDPRAVLAIKEYHYVDDYVNSFMSKDDAVAVSSRVREIHANAGFDLCRFSSSSADVVKALNPQGSNTNVKWSESEEKVLGMYWQPAADDHIPSGTQQCDGRETRPYQEGVSKPCYVHIRSDWVLELLHDNR
ncbi:uncharacterized protein LOC123327454 [Drosophila simulans]|uniref:uncharacterized protein LOC123327454 n=1 Tax=Drosophila simulans TaxID=7240 RepID=UPI001D123C0B|nr:uncharacterized protein LOC123327454 [Drosophila simulans]XP_044779810.1 uncharacterized protein LOC123327454 [Drosophila simulans]